MQEREDIQPALKEALIAVVCCIPHGRVASYGQLAPMINELTGKAISAQMVGRQLSGMPEHEWGQLPWWRVVSKQGIISTMKLGEKGRKQEQLLEKEGVEIDNHCIIDVEEYRWSFAGWREKVQSMV